MISALLLAACRPPAPAGPPPTVRIRIAAINDFHGALYESTVRGHDGVAYGGLPWLVAAVDHLRAEAPSLVLLDAGDQFQGSWPVNASAGLGAVQAMNLLGLDAAAVGNHEFDYGREALSAAVAQAEYPFLTANVHEDGAPWQPEGVQGWTVIERAGKRIGVVGLSTVDTPTTTVPAHVAGLTFQDGVEAVRALLPALQEARLDATVLVGHLTGSCRPAGYLDPGPPCTPDGEIGRLLTELPPGSFDVMVLGHAHTLLAHRQGDTFLLESRAKGQAIGQVDLVFGPDGLDRDASRVLPHWPIVHPPADPGCSGAPFPVDPLSVGGTRLSPHPEAIALIAELEARAGSLCEPIACASKPLLRNRTGESALADWMADAMRAAFPGADIAVQNSGGVRADLAAGTVRRQDLQRVMPFDNRAVLVELSGSQIRTMLRIGSSGAHGILQVSGLSYATDPGGSGGSDLDGDGSIAPWEHDHLCQTILVGDTPLDPAATYRVITSDFLLAGGDHLGPALSDAMVIETGPLVREAMYDYASATAGCIGAAPIIDPDRPRIGSCER